MYRNRERQLHGYIHSDPSRSRHKDEKKRIGYLLANAVNDNSGLIKRAFKLEQKSDTCKGEQKDRSLDRRFWNCSMLLRKFQLRPMGSPRAAISH